METIISGGVGAVIGALITGLISWRLHRDQPERQHRWQTALRFGEFLGYLLNPFTPDVVKSKEDIWKLQQDFAPHVRGSYILGFIDDSSGPITQLVNDYAEDLIAYVDGKMQRGELEQRRDVARKKARQIMMQFTK